jgi:hypothetical protein
VGVGGGGWVGVGVGGWVGGGGWVGVGGGEEKLRIRLNSAQFELNLPVGAELGNILEYQLSSLH